MVRLGFAVSPPPNGPALWSGCLEAVAGRVTEIFLMPAIWPVDLGFNVRVVFTQFVSARFRLFGAGRDSTMSHERE